MSLGIFDVIKKRLASVQKKAGGIDNFNDLIKTIESINDGAELIISDNHTPETSANFRSNLTTFSQSVSTMIEKLSKTNMDDDQKQVYSTLCAIQEPLQLLSDKVRTNKLSSSKQVRDAAFDFSFADGYFYSLDGFKNIKNSEGYVPGSINYGANFEAALDDYKENRNEYQNCFHYFASHITKDHINPEGTLFAKLNLVQSLIKESGCEIKPLSKVGDTYLQLFRIGNSKLSGEDKIDKNAGNLSLEDNNIISSRFFQRALNFAFDPSFIKGTIQGSKEITEKIPNSADAKKHLINMVNAIRPFTKGEMIDGEEDVSSRIYAGCSQELIEKFDKSALLVQSMYSPYKFLGQEASLIQEGQPFHDFYEKLSQFNTKIVDYIDDKRGAKAPTKDDLNSLLDDMGTCIKKLPGYCIFDKDGLHKGTSALLATLKETSMIMPEMKQKTDEIHGIFAERAKDIYSRMMKFVLDAPANTRENLDAIHERLGNTCHLYYEDAITEDEYYKGFLTKMAADPAYNKHIMGLMNQYLDEWAEHYEAGQSYYPKLTLNQNKETYDAGVENAVEGFRPEKECQEPFYRMYMMAKLIEESHSKIKMNDKNIAELTDKVMSTYDSKVFKEIGRVNPTEFKETLDFGGNMKDLVKLGQLRRLETASPNGIDKAKYDKKQEILGEFENCFKGIDKSTIEALTQPKRGLHQNSKEYKAVSQAITAIKTSNNLSLGDSIHDYKKLYNACNDYLAKHDSEPLTITGKQRFNAAAKLAAKLSPIVRQTLKTEDQITAFDQTVKNNENRSKEFKETLKQQVKAADVAVL